MPPLPLSPGWDQPAGRERVGGEGLREGRGETLLLLSQQEPGTPFVSHDRTEVPALPGSSPASRFQ